MTTPSRFLSLRSLALLFMLGMIILFAMGMVRPFLLLPSHYLIWSNEGWNAGHVARFAAGGLLYPSPQDMATNNYTPLSFLLMTPFASMGLDLIFAGRIMALLAWLTSAALIYLGARRMGASPLTAGLGALVMLGTIARFFPYYIAMYEPQWLAHAIMLAGFLCFLQAKTMRGAIFAVILMLLAGLTKHNIIAIPAACFVWMFLYDRKRFYVSLATAALFGGLSIAIIHLSFGHNFWFNLFNARELSLYHFSRKAEHILSIIVPLLAWGAFFFSSHTVRTHKQAVLISLMIAASFLEFLAFASGIGVAANVVFDMVISVSFAMAFMASQHDEAKNKILPLLCGLLLLQVAAWPNMKYLEVAYKPEARALLRERAARIEKTVEALKQLPGEAWCEQAAICYWAGKPYSYDDFNAEQRLATGAITLAELQGQMDRLGVKTLQIDDVKTMPGEPGTYAESTLAPLLPAFKTKIVPEAGLGALWTR